MTRETMAGALAVALAAGGASGQFFDNFDSYSVGDICTQSTWEPWPGSVDVCGEVNDEVFFSGARSLFIQGAVGGSAGLGDDTTHTFSGVTSGQWSFSTMTYVPSTAFGKASFILLNTFPASANPDWSVVIELDSDFGEVLVWPSLPTGVFLTTDEWVELRVDFDLDTDEASYFYDGVLFHETTWTGAIQAGGQLRLQAVDLYGGEPASAGHSGMYYDDVRLEEAGGCYADCDESGTLDFFDFLCFQNAFAAAEPYADCDSSGAHDFFDFLCFQGEFSAGCP